MTPPDAPRPVPRVPKGFRDVFARDVEDRRAMVQKIQEVYERYGFEPLETPAVEYVETLGKFLPESQTPGAAAAEPKPEEGVFAWRDEDENWIALRYDLTAPLSRVVAEHKDSLPVPFRRYQIGPVWRVEKPAPGRFREFYQFDIDTVGSASMAADAEVCCVLADSLASLGIARSDFEIKVNNRKVLNGVLDRIGLLTTAASGGDAAFPRYPKPGARPADGDFQQLRSFYVANRVEQRMAVLRAIDKLDRLGIDGVREMLGNGRLDASGAFNYGAALEADHANAVLAFMNASVGTKSRSDVVGRLEKLVSGSPVGDEGVAELREIDRLLSAAGKEYDNVVFDPSVVRGLAYYTGPVFEAVLTFEIVDEDGNKRQFGAVAGGGRYDNLVERFTGQLVPATGASIGVDRLLAALNAKRGNAEPRIGPVVVVTMDKARMTEYQQMTFELRRAGIAAEMYLGSAGMKAQLKYADKRNSPLAVIAGGNEFEKNEVSIKDLRLGKQLSDKITDRDAWRKDQPAQVTIPRADLVAEVRKRLAANATNSGGA